MYLTPVRPASEKYGLSVEAGQFTFPPAVSKEWSVVGMVQITGSRETDGSGEDSHNGPGNDCGLT